MSDNDAFAAEATRLRERSPHQGPFGIAGVLFMVTERALNRDPNGRRVDPRDVVQDTYLTLLVQRDRYDPTKAGLGKYGGLIASRTAMREMRRSSRAQSLNTDDSDEAPHRELAHPGGPIYNPVERAESAEAKLHVKAAWESLMAELDAAGRSWPKRAIRAVAAFGQYAEASRRLSAALGKEITVGDVRRGVKAALRYPSGRVLAKLWAGQGGTNE